MKGVLIILSLVLPLAAFTTELPTRLLGQEYNNYESCLDWEKASCINMECLTSESTNCQENCQKKAEDKCKDEFDLY